jgi:hypothetical protein
MLSLQRQSRETIRCQMKALALRIPIGTAHHNQTARANSPRWGEKRLPNTIQDSLSFTPLPWYAPQAGKHMARGAHQAVIHSENQRAGSHQGKAGPATADFRVRGNIRPSSNATSSAIPMAVRLGDPTSGQRWSPRRTPSLLPLPLPADSPRSAAGPPPSSKWFRPFCSNFQPSPLSRESGEEDLGARGLLRRGYSAGPVSQTCFT